MALRIDRTRCIACGLCINTCPNNVLAINNDIVEIRFNQSCMECLHCAAVCPQKAIAEEGVDLYSPAPEDWLETLIVTRRAVREFKPDPPEKEVIEHALRVAAWAPAGKNRKSNGWIVLHGKDQVETLLGIIQDWASVTPEFEVLKKTPGKRDLITCNATCALIGYNLTDAVNAETDTVIATTTAELLLTHQGIGTCWGGYLRWALGACDAARNLLKVPVGHSIYTVLLAGIPIEKNYINIPYRKEPDIGWC